ncbi:hypothetical protein AU467_21330 [Mesorhizobium loti]|uniref:Uncharacterized protein n=1 Tax=Rhizobium loti TaxID=381 RepID=A0A117N3L3_RHILI|nr:hypothetical protein AU467_21330 [Mesorhizobium loti]
MADESLRFSVALNLLVSTEKSSAKDLLGLLAFENPRKLRQSVMEITYGSGRMHVAQKCAAVLG